MELRFVHTAGRGTVFRCPDGIDGPSPKRIGPFPLLFEIYTTFGAYTPFTMTDQLGKHARDTNCGSSSAL